MKIDNERAVKDKGEVRFEYYEEAQAKAEATRILGRKILSKMYYLLTSNNQTSINNNEVGDNQLKSEQDFGAVPKWSTTLSSFGDSLGGSRTQQICNVDNTLHWDLI